MGLRRKRRDSHLSQPAQAEKKKRQSDIYEDSCDEASSERNLCYVIERKKNGRRNKKYCFKHHTASVPTITLLPSAKHLVSSAGIGKLLPAGTQYLL